MPVPHGRQGWWTPTQDGIDVAVRVTPGAPRSEVIDTTGERLRIRVAAPAADGKANAEVERFVAKLFGVRASAVSILRGDRAREKTVRVNGIKQLPPDLAPDPADAIRAEPR